MQVLLTYGPKGNDELLEHYGFALEDNPWDSVLCRCVLNPTRVTDLVHYHSDGARYWSWGNATTRGTFSFIQLENDGQNQQTALSINSSGAATFAGNVGIKESSIDANLHITDTNPNIKFERSGQGKWAFGIPNNQTYLAFDETSDDLSTPTMVLTKTTKFVGIGNSDPSQRLHLGDGTDALRGIMAIEGAGGESETH